MLQLLQMVRGPGPEADWVGNAQQRAIIHSAFIPRLS